ncbi:nuf2 [Haematobia irritans]|uniref:nuf2 n=1 Tax=Haematobia irritans TaxID=7368 RepID=UPI003F4FD346
MLTKEDVDGWNNVFSDCQIKPNQLNQPTEGFIVKALVFYTRRFGYKVEPPFELNGENIENNKENRAFLIRLARQIDHFLKITDKSYSFTYYELIRPTPKKTSHTLYILLNYLFYYNMYKEEVFKMANEPIQRFQEKKSLIERHEHEKEQKLLEVKDLKLKVKELQQILPPLRTEHKELSVWNTNEKEELKKTKESIHETTEQLKHLKEQKRTLQRRIVSDEEQRELNKRRETLMTDIGKQKELAASNDKTLRELIDNVKRMQKSKEDIEKAAEIVPQRLLDQLGESKKSLQMAMADEHSAEEKRAHLSQLIAEEGERYKILEKQLQTNKQDLNLKEKQCKSELESRQKILMESNERIRRLQAEDDKLEQELEEQIDISEYLRENIAEILASYK